jgi:hypothetical protein
MTKWTCAHGFGLSETCRECNVDRARQIVKQWGDYVDESRMVIAEAETVPVGPLPSLRDQLISEGLDADVADDQVRQMIDAQR